MVPATLQFETKLKESIRIRINIFKNFICGGISLDIWSDIRFYSSAHTSLLNLISDCIYNDIPPLSFIY